MNLLGLYAWKDTVTRSSVIFIVFQYFLLKIPRKNDEFHIFLTKTCIIMSSSCAENKFSKFWAECSAVSLGTQLIVIFWVYVMPQFVEEFWVMTAHHLEAWMRWEFWETKVMQQYGAHMTKCRVEHCSLLGWSISIIGYTLREDAIFCGHVKDLIRSMKAGHRLYIEDIKHFCSWFKACKGHAAALKQHFKFQCKKVKGW